MLLHVRIKSDEALGKVWRADKEQGHPGCLHPLSTQGATGNDGRGKPTCVTPAAHGAAVPVPGG